MGAALLGNSRQLPRRRGAIFLCPPLGPSALSSSEHSRVLLAFAGQGGRSGDRAEEAGADTLHPARETIQVPLPLGGQRLLSPAGSRSQIPPACGAEARLWDAGCCMAWGPSEEDAEEATVPLTPALGGNWRSSGKSLRWDSPGCAACHRPGSGIPPGPLWRAPLNPIRF